MKKKHTYRTTAIETIQVAELLPALVTGCIVAIDVAKEKFVVALATWAGEVVKLIRFEHPTQTRLFLELVATLQKELGSVKAAMEPTGTYGDALRFQLERAGVPVEMVQPKRTYDSQEVFDGVPSLHDGKSAVLIARLCALQLAKRTRPVDEKRLRLRALVEQRSYEHEREEKCLNRLESRLARHWPEFSRWLDTKQASGLSLLQTYESPARLSADPEGARELLWSVSRRRLSEEAVDGIVQEASATLGVPTTAEEGQFVRTLANEAQAARQRQRSLEKQMHELAAESAAFAHLEAWMGTWTAAVLVAFNDPLDYQHADELVKAMGLNLREKSSGEHEGKLKITKRGPSQPRQVMYLFALRMLEASPEVRAWCDARQPHKTKQPAVIATMRKLVKAAFHVARGEKFEPAKLFDLRRLQLVAKEKPRQPEKRKTPRSIVRSDRTARKTRGTLPSSQGSTPTEQTARIASPEGNRQRAPGAERNQTSAQKDGSEPLALSALPWVKYLGEGDAAATRN